MIYPDEIPTWLAIPSIALTWGIWIAIRIAEKRQRLRRIRQEFARRD